VKASRGRLLARFEGWFLASLGRRLLAKFGRWIFSGLRFGWAWQMAPGWAYKNAFG